MRNTLMLALLLTCTFAIPAEAQQSAYKILRHGKPVTSEEALRVFSLIREAKSGCETLPSVTVNGVPGTLYDRELFCVLQHVEKEPSLKGVTIIFPEK